MVLLSSIVFLSCKKASQESSTSGNKIRILFIGNSLTYTNDLPSLIKELAISRNVNIEYDLYAPGGYTFFQHASDPRLLKKIAQKKWDFVILQEQGQRPAFSQEQLQAEVYPYAQKLCRVVRDANPRARIAFYMTMARRNGDPQNVQVAAELGTYEGMQRRINAGYTQMAQQNRGWLVPVGLVWQNIRAQKPALNLYADDLHPNLTGSYLAACVFYAVLFKDSPAGLPHPQQIDDDTARYLQKVTMDTISAKYQ